MNLTMIFYFIKFKPFKIRYHLIRDIINEISFLIIFSASFPLIDEEDSNENTKKNCAYTIIAAITLILAAELLCILIDYGFMVYSFFNNFCKNR